ncbi:hypothetical protein [Dyadobacter sandarakinus]|uniref:SGNH/GDSL hydrolase family protein n=1 Tax=Dyadobacter sandarakinus TaxID=2747268 RepID=A0ABX7IFQ5_9BACT|nr:hypothetical protein [Dyadobacter sandarakinus]QRR03681.1 hypothetical protein HWI92_23570 [Dyadobacter sandarakinus]
MMRKALFYFIFLIVLYIVTEILLRIGLLFLGYPFFKPSDYIFVKIYPSLHELRHKQISNTDETIDVLILGGSVVSPGYMDLELRLDSIFKKQDKQLRKVAVYNVAAPAHTSLDNAIKYEYLKKQKFDLVIYYEAINDLHGNNIPPAYYRADYTHIKWYKDIEILRRHEEMDITVLPFALDFACNYIKDKVSRRFYMTQYGTEVRYRKYGADVKTKPTFEKNLRVIIRQAKESGAKMLLLSYASCFPENVVLTGEDADLKHYCKCSFAVPISIWGKAEYVKAGIATHNQVIRKLASSTPTLYMDMERAMHGDPRFFCDVCHVSKTGAQYFAKTLADFLITNNVLQ